MRNRLLYAALTAAVISAPAYAGKLDVTTFRYSGPFAINAPAMVDSVDVNSKKYDPASLLATEISLDNASKGTMFTSPTLPATEKPSLHLLNFSIDNERYFSGSLKVGGLKKFETYVDGKKTDDGRLILSPATHEVTVKCLTEGATPDSVIVSIEGDNTSLLTINSKEPRRFTLHDVMTGRRFSSVTLSPSGKYILSAYYTTQDDGSSTFDYQLTEAASGRHVASYSEPVKWMPSSDLLYMTRYAGGKMRMVTINPADGNEKVLVSALPSRYFTVAPTEDYLVYTKTQEGPKEKDANLYEIIHPEDRQPGWRNRGTLMKYDIATGISTALTFGNRNVRLGGISADGRKLLFSVHEKCVEQRPSSLTSLYLLDLADNSTRAIFEKEGFIGSATLSPDGTKIAVSASPEAFGGVGMTLQKGTPSMYDYQLYTIDCADKKITPLTRDFNPSIEAFEWNAADGKIYFTAEDRDLQSLYRVNPAGGKVENLNAREEYVMSFDMAAKSPALVYYGQGASNSDRSYALDTKSLRHKLLDDLSAKRLEGIRIGSCEQWDFVTSRGDSICGRYILPPDFDPAKKYPMIVNYYGGCNPTSRTFEGRYPHHVYAAHGYVVLVIIPRGSAGFGQEYASHHVNTAGEGIAEDIIEGVRLFIGNHPWVDASKIGCIGASYGGFMTQYLQTKTDLFAAAISHAGISDHTSYWGEGYWGYSYSEVCMADSYPWSHTDLYVKRSPLYNADKIYTPILFLHGDSDTNVPFGESIQMYTALRRLGRETAFVAVKGANHQITEFDKRQKWQETIFAWFAKYLQDDPSWWESLYPKKPLN